jgi:hypothetical protein
LIVDVEKRKEELSRYLSNEVESRAINVTWGSLFKAAITSISAWEEVPIVDAPLQVQYCMGKSACWYATYTIHVDGLELFKLPTLNDDASWIYCERCFIKRALLMYEREQSAPNPQRLYRIDPGTYEASIEEKLRKEAVVEESDDDDD